MTSTLKRAIELANLRIGGGQVRIAEALGVSRQKLNDWAHGRVPIPRRYLVQLAELAGLDPEHTIAQHAVELYRLTRETA